MNDTKGINTLLQGQQLNAQRPIVVKSKKQLEEEKMERIKKAFNLKHGKGKRKKKKRK